MKYNFIFLFIILASALSAQSDGYLGGPGSDYGTPSGDYGTPGSGTGTPASVPPSKGNGQVQPHQNPYNSGGNSGYGRPGHSGGIQHANPGRGGGHGGGHHGGRR